MACLFGHKWNGCKCAKCGKVRDSGHQYRYSSNGSKCRGICKQCGKMTDLEHDYQLTDHPCKEKCSRCGRILVMHDFQERFGKCVRVCIRCGEDDTSRPADHKWKRLEGKCIEKCTVCNEERKADHIWSYREGNCIPVCSVCGETGGSWNAKHTWEPVPGECREKCKYCDEARAMKHQYKGGKCTRCGRSIEEPESGTIPPLLWAAVEGDVKEVRDLIAGGANVNRYGPDETPLIGAAAKGYDAAHKEIVKLLLDAGADINATDIYGRTALQTAARKGLNDMAGYLASRGGR